MEVAVRVTGKKAVKVLGAVCLATGIVALSAVVASGAAVGAVAEGFKSAKNTMQKILKKDETVAEDEVSEESTDEVMAAEITKTVNETAVTEEIPAEDTHVAEAIAEES